MKKKTKTPPPRPDLTRGEDWHYEILIRNALAFRPFRVQLHRGFYRQPPRWARTLNGAERLGQKMLRRKLRRDQRELIKTDYLTGGGPSVGDLRSSLRECERRLSPGYDGRIFSGDLELRDELRAKLGPLL